MMALKEPIAQITKILNLQETANPHQILLFSDRLNINAYLTYMCNLMFYFKL